MKVLFAAAMALLLTTSIAAADTVLMDNGDRYRGRVTGMSSGSMQLQSDFGKLSLPWKRIVELKVDQPLQVTLESGARLNGTLTLQQGQIQFAESELTDLLLPPSAVVALSPPDAPDFRLEARLNVGLAATSGNTDTESYHVDGEFITRTSRDRFRLGGQLNYGSEDSRRSENNAAAVLAYDHFFSSLWYLNTNFGVARDEFKDLKLRTTAGAGIGHQFRDQTDDRLAVEIGLSYIHEVFEVGEDRGQPAARYALNFIRRLSLGPVLFHRHEFLAGLEHSKDVLLHTETGLRLTLLQNITGTLQLNYDHDWHPSPGTARGDTAYLLTFGYEFRP